MRALVWIVEDTWKATVRAAAEFLPTDADLTLLYVREGEAESVARGALHGLLGRRSRAPAESIESLSEQSAGELLAQAQTTLGRQSSIETRSGGRIEQEVLAAADGMDVLLMARDGDRVRCGPHNLGPTGRFVVEHAQCAVLLVWPD